MLIELEGASWERRDDACKKSRFVFPFVFDNLFCYNLLLRGCYLYG